MLLPQRDRGFPVPSLHGNTVSPLHHLLKSSLISWPALHCYYGGLEAKGSAISVITDLDILVVSELPSSALRHKSDSWLMGTRMSCSVTTARLNYSVQRRCDCQATGMEKTKRVSCLMLMLAVLKVPLEQ